MQDIEEVVHGGISRAVGLWFGLPCLTSVDQNWIKKPWKTLSKFKEY